jgi:hypothetical protein
LGPELPKSDPAAGNCIPAPWSLASAYNIKMFKAKMKLKFKRIMILNP